MKELDKSVQIEILKGAVRKLRHEEWVCGCCAVIIKSARELKGIHTTCSELKYVIPSFNRENAFRLSKQKKFKKPKPTNPFWWKVNTDRNPRIRFLNALISEIKATM